MANEMTKGQDAVNRTNRIHNLLTEIMNEIEYVSSVDRASLPLCGALIGKVAELQKGPEMMAFRKEVSQLRKGELAR